MATAEALLAQTVTRPDAAARKPAHESATAEGGQSFAEILGAETDVVGESAVIAPMVAPAVQTAPVLNAATQLALLAGMEIAAPGIAPPEVSAGNPDVMATISAAPAVTGIVLPQPAVALATGGVASAVEPVTTIATGPAAPALAAVTPAPVAPAAATSPVVPKTPSPEAVVESDVAVLAPAVDAALSIAPTTARVAAFVAPTAVAMVAPVAAKPAETTVSKLAMTKPTTPLSDISTGAPSMAARPETALPVEPTPIVPVQPSAQADEPTAAPSQPAAGQPAAQATAKPAASAATVAPEIKTDIATTSSTTSTSAVDTLAAARTVLATPTATQTAPPPALQTAPAAAVQVHARFVERFDGRAQRFEVSLQPAELGRVDVRIEIGADRKVHAVLAAHDSATLTDLMRGQRALERALSDAGIDLAKDGLKFELSQDTGRNASGWQRGDAWADRELAHAWRGFSAVDVPVEASPAEAAVAAVRSYGRTPRLDLVA